MYWFLLKKECKRLVNKNLNHVLTQGDYIQTFFAIVRSTTFHQAFAKFIFHSLKFFPHETSFPKSTLNIPGKEDVEAYSEPSRTSNMGLFEKII